MSRLDALLQKHPATGRAYDYLYQLHISFLCRHFPVEACRRLYRDHVGKDLNLEDPKDFNEKLQWMKLYGRHPLQAACADKQGMKEYVAGQGLGHLLPRTLGLYGRVEDIPWRDLPDQFVLKCTHGCGFNLICRDKGRLDLRASTRKLRKWMRIDYGVVAAEFHYSAIRPRILCEEYLADGTGLRPTDYKVYCFAGKPHCILACTAREESGLARFDFYDPDWRELPYIQSGFSSGRTHPRPEALSGMLAACETLAGPFPFVRMDFYDIGGRAVLGEMTFTPMGGMETGLTPLALETLGRLLELPDRIP